MKKTSLILAIILVTLIGENITAKATATHTTSAGSKDYSMSVTLKCSATGVLS